MANALSAQEAKHIYMITSQPTSMHVPNYYIVVCGNKEN